LSIGTEPNGSISRALAGDTIVQTRRLQEGITQFFPVGQKSDAMPTGLSPCWKEGLPNRQYAAEEPHQVGIGIEYG
jgi:hypothetical protein